MLELVSADQVQENNEQPEEETILEEEITGTVVVEEGEFQASGIIKTVLEDVLDLTTGGMEMHGFTRHTFAHPTKDHDVEYFIKGQDVIMADYHGTNTFKIEALGKEDAQAIIDNIK